MALRFCKMTLETTIAFIIISTCFAAPMDDPIRIDLPVYDQPQSNSDLLLAQTLQPENYPGGDSLANQQVSGGNLVTSKLKVANLVGNSLNSKVKSLHDGGVFSAPVTDRETVLQETEGYGSKLLSIKENIHGGFAGVFQPKPIVDTISESEKYGNTGDKFYTTGRAIVGGAEGFANFVNTVLEIPGTFLKSITRTATEKLNNLGGRLIGL